MHYKPNAAELDNARANKDLQRNVLGHLLLAVLGHLLLAHKSREIRGVAVTMKAFLSPRNSHNSNAAINAAGNQLEALDRALTGDKHGPNGTSRWISWSETKQNFIVPPNGTSKGYTKFALPDLATITEVGLDATWKALHAFSVRRWLNCRRNPVALSDALDFSHVRTGINPTPTACAPASAMAAAAAISASRSRAAPPRSSGSSRPVRHGQGGNSGPPSSGLTCIDTTSPMANCLNCGGTHPGGVRGCALPCGAHGPRNNHKGFQCAAMCNGRPEFMAFLKKRGMQPHQVHDNAKTARYKHPGDSGGSGRFPPRTSARDPRKQGAALVASGHRPLVCAFAIDANPIAGIGAVRQPTGTPFFASA